MEIKTNKEAKKELPRRFKELRRMVAESDYNMSCVIGELECLGEESESYEDIHEADLLRFVEGAHEVANEANRRSLSILSSLSFGREQSEANE